jgi:hypothetical protein
MAPVALAGTGGVSRFCRFSTRSSPSFTYCLLTAYTRRVVHPHGSAISLCSGALPAFPPDPSPHVTKAVCGRGSFAGPDGRPWP